MFVGGDPGASDGVDPRRGIGADAVPLRPQDHGRDELAVPGDPEHSDRADDALSGTAGTHQVRNADHDPRPPEGHLRPALPQRRPLRHRFRVAQTVPLLFQVGNGSDGHPHHRRQLHLPERVSRLH